MNCDADENLVQLAYLMDTFFDRRAEGKGNVILPLVAMYSQGIASVLLMIYQFTFVPPHCDLCL
jgi:hypothetical protein